MHCCGGERFLSSYLPLQPTVPPHLSFLFPFSLLYPAPLFRHFPVKLTSVGGGHVSMGGGGGALQFQCINSSSFCGCEMVVNPKTFQAHFLPHIHDRGVGHISTLSQVCSRKKKNARALPRCCREITGHLLINQCGHTQYALENPLLKTACVCAVSSICVFHYSETKGTRAVRGPTGGVIATPACARQRFSLIMAARRKLARRRPRHAGLQIPPADDKPASAR